MVSMPAAVLAMAVALLSRGSHAVLPSVCDSMPSQQTCAEVTDCEWTGSACQTVYRCDEAGDKAACDQTVPACVWENDSGECQLPEVLDECSLTSAEEACKHIDKCSFVGGKCLVYDPCNDVVGEAACKASAPCRWTLSRCIKHDNLCPRLSERYCSRQTYLLDQCRWDVDADKCFRLEEYDSCSLVVDERKCEGVRGCSWDGGSCRGDEFRGRRSGGKPGNREPSVGGERFDVSLRVVAARVEDIVARMAEMGERMTAALGAGSEWSCTAICRVARVGDVWAEKQCWLCSGVAGGSSRGAVPLADESYVVKGKVRAPGLGEAAVEAKIQAAGGRIVGSGLTFSAAEVASAGTAGDEGGDDGFTGGELAAIIVCCSLAGLLLVAAVGFACYKRAKPVRFGEGESAHDSKAADIECTERRS